MFKHFAEVIRGTNNENKTYAHTEHSIQLHVYIFR